MSIKAIKTEQDYKEAFKRLESIFEALPGTVEGDELEALAVLIDNFEKNHFPVDLPDPVEAIKFRTEQLNSINQAI
ncbi:MAG: DNA-binding protein [Mucilaginibacter sp.]|nr:DNA-binding protein [Mucilaginibacter sp.]